MRTFCWRIFPVLAVACALVGCKSYPVNAPLAKRDPDKGYYLHLQPRVDNSGEILFVLAFSGGGTRAAAFSYGVLEQLRDTAVKIDGRQESLLHEVDAISSVSGGSVTAAAYGLYGDKIFGTLESAFLKRNVQRNLALRVINPLRWPSLWSTTYGRSELAEDFYDQILFHGATFADIQKAGGPYIVINATDISNGARFEFTQYTFDMLCSDLSNFPVSRAVAASSAVPGLLTPLTINNYAGGCGYEVPEWVTRDYHDGDGRIRLRARELASMLDSTNRPYLHLVDGGVSDNLGLRPILDTITLLESSPELRDDLRVFSVKKLVVISANAYSSPAKDWDKSPAAPGSLLSAAAAASLTLDRYSVETLELVRSEFSRWQREMGGTGNVKLYPVMLNFSNFKEAAKRNFFLNLPTSFFLPGPDVDKLRDAGHVLLRENSVFQELLKDLGPGAQVAQQMN